MTNLVGLIPAAGQGKRTAPLPCSKEIFPIGFTKKVGNQTQTIPKAVGLYLLERMVLAGVRRVFVTLSNGKWDIMRYFGDGSAWGVSIAYLFQENLWGMPYALNLAYPWLRDEIVLFGMPDTIFEPENAFQRLLEAHRQTMADVTLGLFPTTTPARFGMVSFDSEGRLLYVIDKPVNTLLKHMWGIACWGPAFTEFMKEYLQSVSPPSREVLLGDIFQLAMEKGLIVRVLPFEEGEYIDVGTPEELTCAIHRFSRMENR